MLSNFSKVETLKISKNWRNTNEQVRIKIINNFLKNNSLYKNLQAVKALDDGQVIFKIENGILVSNRVDTLLNLEHLLKKNFDQGINLWCEVVSDKSKLRQLRGIVINS